MGCAVDGVDLAVVGHAVERLRGWCANCTVLEGGGEFSSGVERVGLVVKLRSQANESSGPEKSP